MQADYEKDLILLVKLEKYKDSKIKDTQDKAFQDRLELYRAQRELINKAWVETLPVCELIDFSEEEEKVFFNYAMILFYGKDYMEFIEKKSGVSLIRLERSQLERIGRTATLIDTGLNVIKYVSAMFIISSFFAVLGGLIFQMMPMKSILALVFLNSFLICFLFNARESAKHVIYRLVKEDHVLRYVLEEHKISKQLEHDKD